jgi:REP element-mobilizing transposase RayT
VPRKPRDEEPGATHHVYIHAVDDGRIVWDDIDRQTLLSWAEIAIRRKGWICVAICVMDNHFHLVVTTPEPNLGEGMQLMNGGYAQYVNRRHGRKGHLFRARFESKRVLSDAHLLWLVRYIARNPTEAGITTDPCAYPWSSYPGVVGVTRCWPYIAKKVLLEHFGSGESAIQLLRDFVEGSAESEEAA